MDHAPDRAPRAFLRKRSMGFGHLFEVITSGNSSGSPDEREQPTSYEEQNSRLEHDDGPAQGGSSGAIRSRVSRALAALKINPPLPTTNTSSSSNRGTPTNSPPRGFPVIPRQRSSQMFHVRPWAAVMPGRCAKDPAETGILPQSRVDSLPGAAARKSARELRTSSRDTELQHIHGNDEVSCDKHRTLYEREFGRESGISLSMDDVQLSNNEDGPMQLKNKRNPLDCLPPEMISLIFSFLPFADFLRVERVAKSWKRIATDAQLQKEFFIRRFGVPKLEGNLQLSLSGQGIGKLNQIYQDWKTMYRVRVELEKRWNRGPIDSRATAIYLNGHTDSVYCLQFDEDKIITGSRDRTLRIWDVKTGALRKVVGVPKAVDRDRRDGEQMGAQPVLQSRGLSVVSNKSATLPASVYHVPRFYHDASILCLQYDSEILVSGSSDCTLIVWDLKTWQPIHRLERHGSGVLDIAFDRQKIVSCSKDSSVCVWDRITGALLTQLHGHRGPVNAVQMRGDLVVSASGEGCAKLWRLYCDRLGTTDAECSAKVLQTFWSKDRGLACVEFSADGKEVLAGGNDQVIYRFDADSGAIKECLKGHSSLVRSLYLDGVNQRVVSGGYDLSIRVWDLRDILPSKDDLSAHRNGGARNPRLTEAEASRVDPREMWKMERWATSWVLSAKCDYRRIVSTSQDGRGLIIDLGAGIKDIELLEN